MKFELYIVDCETTGLSFVRNEPVEISIYRLSNGNQMTWNLKPINMDNIEQGALRVNGLKIEDLKGLTKEGRDKYIDPIKVIAEIENWLNDDDLPKDQRIMVGQNIAFDKNMMMFLWEKCGTKESFPFSDRHSLDTMQLEFLFDYIKGEYAQGYSLNNLSKKYGVKNEKAHTATEDVKTTVAVFNKQIEYLKSVIKT